ncbi:MAG: hypothetical protein M0T74_18595 [Desulfitobacterium hafniense]|nr:hypothetical protein [Desulfitobacterium hafniense]
MHYHIQYVPIYNPYPHVVYRLPVNYLGGYEPLWWERYEEQFQPAWLQKMEREYGFAPGREPLWWELFEEQFEPAWLQREERRLGIPQPFDPRFDLPPGRR